MGHMVTWIGTLKLSFNMKNYTSAVQNYQQCQDAAEILIKIF